MAFNRDPDIDLDGLIVACGKYGGPIATVRDPSKPVRATAGVNDINIYDAFGSLVKAVPSKTTGGICVKFIGWTAREDLVVIYSNGQVDMYVVSCCVLAHFIKPEGFFVTHVNIWYVVIALLFCL